MTELLLGCGSSRLKKLAWQGGHEWSDLVTLDFADTHKPDVVHDIAKLPLPFADNTFDIVTIAFGLRNVTDKDAALRSM